eukprot:scaffold43951_cov44-Tisochrysis_lutea.AAC.1
MSWDRGFTASLRLLEVAGYAHAIHHCVDDSAWDILAVLGCATSQSYFTFQRQGRYSWILAFIYIPLQLSQYFVWWETRPLSTPSPYLLKG